MISFSHETYGSSLVESQSMALIVFIAWCVVSIHVNHLTEVRVSDLWDRLRTEVLLHLCFCEKNGALLCASARIWGDIF